MSIDTLGTNMRKLSISAVTLTTDKDGRLIVAARQHVKNRSGMITEVTHTHTAEDYDDAADKVLKDAELLTQASPTIIELRKA